MPPSPSSTRKPLLPSPACDTRFIPSSFAAAVDSSDPVVVATSWREASANAVILFAPVVVAD
ncbi:hypothetical protein DAI22_04g276000 [Oryza sativa Japonica Group]|nr:hypothetical protein DAI22_04g276000 [Oryza sativa Japonica Group]